MGEDEVLAAAVDIQRQIFLAHGRAFDMPAGTALAPGTFPEGFAGLGRLPQGKVQRVLLFFTGGHAGTGLQFVQAAAGELAVGRIGPHTEVHVAGRHGIGLALGNELGTEILHLLDVFCGAGLVIGTHHIQAVHVFMEGVDIGLAHFAPVTFFLIGAADDLVVHVGKVADKGHIQSQGAQVAHQHVEDQGGTGMADVAVVIGGDAADIHVDFSGPDGDEFFLFAGKGIVELHDRPPD